MARMNGLQVTDEAINAFKELNVVKPETVSLHHTSLAAQRVHECVHLCPQLLKRYLAHKFTGTDLIRVHYASREHRAIVQLFSLARAQGSRKNRSIPAFELLAIENQ